ncbi:hypothetical protein V6N12_028779 [Hibiscus sabdariffa]|uniref:Uncharacterized protein n=1 Tax=Hibiscus sabdariffa TaxID=183260 RepID=A0ABR2F6V2_9ROSI
MLPRRVRESSKGFSQPFIHHHRLISDIALSWPSPPPSTRASLHPKIRSTLHSLWLTIIRCGNSGRASARNILGVVAVGCIFSAFQLSVCYTATCSELLMMLARLCPLTAELSSFWGSLEKLKIV